MLNVSCYIHFPEIKHTCNSKTTSYNYLTPNAFICTFQVAGLTCKEDEHNFNNQRCCRKCPPGEGVVSPCSLTNNTVCEPCTAGVTFSDTLSHQDVCKSCSKCDSVTHVHRTCNVTENTACECNANYFYNVTSEECVACAGCPLGFGASNVCTHHVNTRCRACPNGTFSDRRDHAGCVVCRVCRPGQLLLQSCSTMQNTVCLGKWLYASLKTLSIVLRKLM